MDGQSIGQRIAAVRKKLRKSQEEFAALAGVGRSYLAEIESGAKQPSYSFLEAVAERTRASTDYLMFSEGQMFRVEVKSRAAISEPIASYDGSSTETLLAIARILDEWADANRIPYTASGRLLPLFTSTIIGGTRMTVAVMRELMDGLSAAMKQQMPPDNGETSDSRKPSRSPSREAE